MTSEDPATIAQRQLEAFNARDLQAYMAVWADDAEYHLHPQGLIARGQAEIARLMRERFAEPNLHGELVRRKAIGNLVVDTEVVTRTLPQGPAEVDVTAVYQVERGKIVKGWFVRGEPRFPTAAPADSSGEGA